MHEILQMLICEFLSRVNYAVHISFHQLSYYVNIFKASWCWWFQNINKVNNVFLVEKFQKFDFSNNTFGIDKIFKCFWYFLNSHFLSGRVVISTAYHTISSVSYLFYVLVF